MMLNDVIQERGLTQLEAATLTGVGQPKVSHIIHGRLGKITESMTDKPEA